MTVSNSYLYVNIGEFKKDLEKYCTDNCTYIKTFLKELGLNQNTLFNAVNNFKRNNMKIDLNKYEKVESAGMIQKPYFDYICSVCNFDKEKYIIKMADKEQRMSDFPRDLINDKSIRNDLQDIKKIIQDEKEESGNYSLSIIQRIDKLEESLKSIGQIQTQNMEYLKNISEGIQRLNDKYNKPSAYLRK